jgi:quinoprotein glucose dehydrogenase
MNRIAFVRFATTFVALALFANFLLPADPPKSPMPDSLKALKQIRVPQGMEGRVWASEPLMANPVSFAFDGQGRVYLAETYRLHHGVTDNRSHMNWLDDDLASKTVDDRVAMYRKYAKDRFTAEYEKESDQVRLIWDSTGSGAADKATVFAKGFSSAASGIGAGLLVRPNGVYYTCIPDLWLLRDTKGTGHADVRDSLATGFGVHVAFLGHDLHGLRMGPDGRVYFSTGDRAINVQTKDGRHVEYTIAGCVMRCEQDGSNLEVFHRGLRNPQELAFDKFGNLFTVDNNSDSGDQARLVNIVDGGDSGWRMCYQYGSHMSDRGPFNAEWIWYPHHDGQPAYIVPPLANMTSGPSGLCYNPGGAALPDKYADHLFICDFRGGADNSGIWAFSVKPSGASFELVKKEQFVWRVLATDCDFAPDGGFYVSDWVEGWEQTGKGRLYRFADPQAEKKPIVGEVKKLLAEGFDKRSNDELGKLLTHPDMRIRQEAQFGLAARGAQSQSMFESVAFNQALSPEERLARLHAIWGLGQLGRAGIDVKRSLATLSGDHDSEVRAQSIRMLGDLAAPPALLTPSLKDSEPRVRLFAALSLGRSLRLKPDQLEKPNDLSPVRADVLEMIRENADADAYLRHAGVVALAECHPETIDNAASESAPVRLAIVLALRRNIDKPNNARLLAKCLADPEPRIAVEAVRALHDEFLTSEVRDEVMVALGSLARQPKLSEAVLYRALNANFRLGGATNAETVAALAASPEASQKLRAEAISMLGDWAKPAGRDRVMGDWRPLPKRDPQIAMTAFRAHLGSIFAGPDEIRKQAATVAAKLGVKEVSQTLRQMAADNSQSISSRVAALRALESLKDPQLDGLVQESLRSQSPRIRAEALGIFANRMPDQAVARLTEALAKGDLVEQQAALAALGRLKRPDADQVMLEWIDRLKKGQVPEGLRLDVREAVSARRDSAMIRGLAEYEINQNSKDPLAKYRDALVGGDAERGRSVFLNKAELTCVKCHKLNGIGGDVGPELAGIGGKQKRDYLLESIVSPDKQIAKGYDSVVLDLSSGKSVTGVLKSEDAREVRLMTAEGLTMVVPKNTIEERRRGKSPMPEDLVQKMTLHELRDLVEFLAGLK